MVMVMNNELIKIIKEKAVGYFETKTCVHLTIRASDVYYKFYNGFIVDIKESYLMFNDEKVGKIPFFFNEIVKLEPKEERK